MRLIVDFFAFFTVYKLQLQLQPQQQQMQDRCWSLCACVCAYEGKCRPQCLDCNFPNGSWFTLNRFYWPHSKRHNHITGLFKINNILFNASSHKSYTHKSKQRHNHIYFESTYHNCIDFHNHGHILIHSGTHFSRLMDPIENNQQRMAGKIKICLVSNAFLFT